ncbi:MAG: TonB-dependent receptor, partial [Psychrobium sp.]|nr:TonB-dependent receptor [Psychrobium sp.]
TPDARSGSTTGDADLSTNAFSAYLETDLTISERLTLSPGVRYEAVKQIRNGALYKGNPHPTYDTKNTNQFTWGVSGLFKASDIVNVYAGVHKAFQPPTFKEAVDPTSGAANDIDAETSINYEIGVRLNTDDQLHAEITLFQTNFDNQIAKDAGVMRNIGETRQSGVELNVSAPWNNWVFDANATLLDTEQLSGNNRGNQLVMAPKQTFNAGMKYRTTLSNNLETYIRLEGQYIGKQFTDTANTVAESINGYKGMLPSYTVINLKGEINKGDWKIFAGVNNLLNKNYRVRRQGFFGGIIPGATRSIYVGASLTF